MARSPFQGTFQQGVRPTVVTAPDALVYINGEVDILGCARCKRRFDWNKYITSIQTDLNIDSSPGSASITLSVPRHSVDEFYFEGEPLVTPMMEIEIFAKGYYLVEGVPQYYPIFWGLVTEVTDSYSNGEHTFSINCSDILKWWELCKMNVNSAFTEAVGQGGRSIFGNVFYGMNPYDVIWTLAQQSFGDVVVGTGSLVSMVREKNPAFKSTFQNALGDIMQYWNQRFSKIRSNLLLYGTTGNAVRGDTLQTAYHNGKSTFGRPFASQLVRQANGGAADQMDFDPADPSVVAFRTQGTQAGQVNFWQTEYQTKLELANAAKEAIGFEFYMDTTGDIVFKPPFYNLDVLSNKPVSWIQDIDVISWDFSNSEAEVITQIQLQGNYTGNIDWGMPEEATPYTSVTDYHLLRKYGWRTQTYNSEFLASPQLMFYVGLDMLDRINAKRHSGTVNIPLRPELRLGFPVYLASKDKDQVWYVRGISHNVSYGAQAQTTLSLTAKRGKFLAPQGIGTIKLTGFKGPKEKQAQTLLKEAASKLSARQLSSGGQFKADVGDAAQIPPTNSGPTSGVDPYATLILRHPKTGRVMGYPNVVMAYTRPFNPTPDQLSSAKGEKKKTDARTVQSKAKANQEAQQKQLESIDQNSFTFTNEDAIREKHLTNRYSYGINSAGVYTYLQDTSKVIKEMLLLPSANITFNQTAVKFSGQTGMIRPVSDERGFEVIGHHKYGRGVSLRDGSLILSDGNNARADVGIQLALSGGLYETLQAQSRNLTTVTNSFTNPADAVARLAPDELQTAAAINPDTKKPEIALDGTNFIDSAPLNSAEQQGATTPASVEATQLSRALTLAEMGVRESTLAGDASDGNCDCITGRADLDFISIGYQIQDIPVSQDDIDDQTAKVAIANAKKIAAEDQLVQVGTIPLQTAIDREINKIADKASATEKQAILSAWEAEKTGQAPPDPLGPRPYSVLDRSRVTGRIEKFLANLYKALDEPHQQYEKELRGEMVPQETKTPTQVRFQTDPSTQGNFTPPFSTPSRAAGGDPAAIALQAKTAINDSAKAWDEFGGKLKSQAERTRLQGEISKDQSELTRLEKQLKDYQGVLNSGGKVVNFSPTDPQFQGVVNTGTDLTTEQQLQNKINELSQDIEKNQTSLAQLNQKYPT